MTLAEFLPHIEKHHGGFKMAERFSTFHNNKLDLIATRSDWYISFMRFYTNFHKQG